MAQLSPTDMAEKKTAIQLNIPESLVEKVVSHKWKEVHKAQYLHRSIEDSGLGTFSIRAKVVTKRISKIEGMLKAYYNKLQGGIALTEKEVAKYQRICEQLAEDKLYLETKI